jgi:hypothetical protein
VATPPAENHAALAVQLTRAATIFDGIANGLTAQVRHAMGVTKRADPDLEQELLRLRARLDELYPEYRQLFGGLLLDHIGREHVPSVLAALGAEPVQEYFRAVPRMDAELQSLLIDLAQRMSRAARQTASPLAAPETARASHSKLVPGFAQGPSK